MDDRLGQLLAAALARHPDAHGRCALVAVGGYGRGELSVHSDVDVVLVHEPSLSGPTVEALAAALWYPLWDCGVTLDHAVRDTLSARALARADLRAALGMLDARHVAGDADLVRSLRSAVLADWRRDATVRVPALAQTCADRAERAGDLAYAAVPDLKQSRGGLRDGVVLRSLVATWLVDVSHRLAEQHRAQLLDVRDALHLAAGRRGDRLHPELLPEVARLVGMSSEELDHQVRDLGRRTAHLGMLTWRRIDQVLASDARPARPIRRRPRLVRLEDGVAAADGEVVLDPAVRPDGDPWLVLRAAAAAATRGLPLSPATVARLAGSDGPLAAPLPEPWPEHARRSLVQLLTAGAGLVPVWQELDQCGVVDKWLPEWGQVRLRTSDSAVHRFTVDRHLVETCVQATRLLPAVARPDLLAVAALLHDIGKGDPVGLDHSEAGAAVAGRIARRWGFTQADAEVVRFLVRHHLLLPHTAVRRDIDDADTVRQVVAVIGNRDRLDLLAALTEADARAAAPAAWTSWRAGLVQRLTDAVRQSLGEHRPAAEPRAGDLPEWTHGLTDGLTNGEMRLEVDQQLDGCRVRVVATDRVGLLADVAGALATAGLTVRAARASVHGTTAVSSWDVDGSDVDAARLRLRLDRVIDGGLDVAARLASPATADVCVRLLPGASTRATVLEVRAPDHLGLCWRLCRTLADAAVDVRSAHLDTLGPQTEDVVYVTGHDGRPLSGDRAEEVRRAVAVALGAGAA